MDGTVYQGNILFPYTQSALDLFRRCGVGYTFLTNNSSKSSKDYFHKIIDLGFGDESDELYTSALSTLDFLKQKHPEIRSVFLLGTESLRREFLDFGYDVLFDGNSDAEPDAVIAAFDTSLTYDRLCKTCWWVKQGKPYFATHPDMVCPTELPTILVDCGAIIDCIAAATGRRPDRVFGKPDPMMIEGIIQRHGLKQDEIAMVGDRLYTDIAMARRAGIAGVLVLSGEATRDDVENGETKPDIVADDISSLARAIRDAKSV